MTVSTAGPDTIATEEASWWERDRRTFLLAEVRGLAPRRVLDAGCGRGSYAAELAEGIDLVVAVDGHVFEEWRSRERPARLAFVQASVDSLPFKHGAFDVALALDVIEHLPEDLPPLAELRRVTARTGVVGISVPAHRRLWSLHDESVGHLRRYGRVELERSLRRAHLATVRSTHFFSWLTVPAWFLRDSGLRSSGASGRPGRAMGPISRVLSCVERRLARGRHLPLGTSLWALARPSGPLDEVTGGPGHGRPPEPAPPR